MFPSLQPSRPKVAITPQGSPTNQQQHRSAAAASSTPRSQIEAMPPLQAPVEPRFAPTPFNPATTHPVFFGAWRKPPFQIPSSSGLSPVATGYVFGEHNRREVKTKL